MKPYTRQGLSAQNINPHSPEPSATLLMDSKSLTHLSNNEDTTKRFRQTAYYPKTVKKSNFQFLRNTVNAKNNVKNNSNNQAASPPSFKAHRKPTEDPNKQPFQPRETGASGWKVLNIRQLDKKNTNPEKKEEPNMKPFIPNNRSAIKKDLQEQKSQGEKTPLLKEHKNLHKRIFTPKNNKHFFQQSRTSPKLGTSYSTSDLRKMNVSNSPTNQSVTTRLRKSSTSAQISDFEKIKFLGEGKFGQVYLVRHTKSHSLYALKQIQKIAILENDMMKQFIMEIKLQLYLNHPNVLKLYGTFDDKENIYLILEYMEEATLYYHLKKKRIFKQDQASRKLRDILDGIAYLHTEQVAHRDIKPENIVISHDVCKIGDFGWAALCDDRRKTLCGTIDYASPELLEGKQYGTAIDLWCVGVLCFQLIVGKAPFYHASRKETMKRIIKADFSDLQIPSSVPSEAMDFISRMLKKNPDERMSAEEALSHPLILKYNEEDMDEFRSAQRKK